MTVFTRFHRISHAFIKMLIKMQFKWVVIDIVFMSFAHKHNNNSRRANTRAPGDLFILHFIQHFLQHLKELFNLGFEPIFFIKFSTHIK